MDFAFRAFGLDFFSSGTLTTNNSEGSEFLITSVSGNVNGSAITGLSSYSGADDYVYYPGDQNILGEPFLDQDGFSVTTADGNQYRDYFLPGFTYEEEGTDGSGGHQIDFTLSPIACFSQETHILTARGPVAVEALAIGDLATTSSGAQRPIRWLGHRTLDCAGHPQRTSVMPVRIAAHAFGTDRPIRDLFVSPGHAIVVDLLGEVLIPAAQLINGTTIRQESVERVTYWHVELDSHDVILAENLATESYLEMGNRGFFAEANLVVLRPSPDERVWTHADFCRTFVDGGPALGAARARLAERATLLMKAENACCAVAAKRA